MGRAETITLLPLDRYKTLMKMHPCHFNGVNGALAPMAGGCDDLWDQDDREELALSIAEAEQLIANELGFWPAPKWITCEQQRIGKVRGDWWNAEFKTKWSYVESFGVQVLTAIDPGAPVTYENRRNDYYGRAETAIIGEPGMLYYFPTGQCDDVCKVRVFFREADGAWDTADPRWEIRPLTADVEPPGTIITAESCLFVRPELWEQLKAEYPSGEQWWADFDLDNLVDAVDVYCESTNTTLPAALSWDGLDACSGTPCALTSQDACALVTDKNRGHFTIRPATGSNAWTSSLYDFPPAQITYSYRAGYPLDPRTCRMHPLLERAIVKLTNSLLSEPPCGYCDIAERIWKSDRENVDPLVEAAVNMPWDLFSRGAYEAWKIVKRFAKGRGGSVRG